MATPSKNHIPFLLIFLLAVSLRLVISLVNRDFNDNHMGVVRTIMLRNSLPIPSSDPKTGKGGESFQPKLYHYTVAKVAEKAGVDPNDKNHLILTGQLVNFAASVILLLVVWVFLERFPVHDEKIKIWTFALAALSPPLVGINVQATNDTFVILFSTLTVYFCYLYLNKANWTFMLLSIVFASLAAASKTNSWVATLAIVITLTIRAISPKLNYKQFIIALAFPLLVGALAFFNPLTQYVAFYRAYGSPFLINLEPAPTPHFFVQTSIPYAGILSIQDGFFTFKFLSLLKTPYIEVYPELSQAHRSSFWTMLYAQSQSLHFNSWPPTWSEGGLLIFSITRGLFIFGLLPILLILIGTMTNGFEILGDFFRKNPESVPERNSGLFFLLCCGYIGFVLLYTFIYRIFTVMGIHFLLPGLLGFMAMFIKGNEKIGSLIQNGPGLATARNFVFSTLLILYLLELATLINRLYHTPNPFL